MITVVLLGVVWALFLIVVIQRMKLAEQEAEIALVRQLLLECYLKAEGSEP